MKAMLLMAVLAGGVGAGCASFYPPEDDGSAVTETAIQNLQVDVQRLKEKVDGVSQAQEELFKRLEEVRAAQRADGEQSRRRLDEMESSVRRVDAATQEARTEITRDLSARMAQLLKADAAAPAPRGSAGGGYEHVVKAGETLSAIAAAYKVTPAAILKANNLKDANLLKVGQKLVIPESAGGR